MRVISGKFGSRRLVSFQANHVRPTTDRIKEVIFNGPHIKDFKNNFKVENYNLGIQNYFVYVFKIKI